MNIRNYRVGYLLKRAFEWIGALAFAAAVCFVVFMYVSNLMAHGCVLGTTCISVMR